MPYFLNGIGGSELASAPIWLLALLALAIFGMGLSIVYLLIFNRPTRQSLHDLATRTYVIAESGLVPSQAGPLWRGHLVVICLLMVCATLAPVVVQRWMSIEQVDILRTAQQAILKNPQVREAGIFDGWTMVKRVGEDATKTTYVTITAVLRADAATEDATLAEALANSALDAYPQAQGRDTLQIVLQRGYDIGIASYWQSNRYAFTPTEWRARGPVPQAAPHRDEMSHPAQGR